jgi:myo-inositol catabolism protein IolC
VPAEDSQLGSVGGDVERYDSELRPELMRRAMVEIQDSGIEVDVWKIEGVDRRSDCEMLVSQARSGGRENVVCVVLGRGADDAKVDHWLTQAAPVDGFVGFAIGRSIWWDPLKAYVDGKIERAAGARKIAEKFLHFVSVYERSKAPVAS